MSRRATTPQAGLVALWRFNFDPLDATGNHSGTQVGAASYQRILGSLPQ